MKCSHRNRPLAVSLRFFLLLPALYAGPGIGQGTGPPDLGWVSHLILGVWLLFWLGVLIYPIALLVFLIWFFVAPETIELDAERTGQNKAFTVIRWAVMIHLGLTLAATVFFAFN